MLITDPGFDIMIRLESGGLRPFEWTWANETAKILLLRDKLVETVQLRNYSVWGYVSDVRLTEKGKAALWYEKQKRNYPPFRVPSLTVSELIALQPKPNDICEHCSEAVFVPDHAVRCEYGSCIYDYGTSTGEALQFGWCEILEQDILFDKDKTKPVYFRQPIHMCETCFGKRHKFTLPQLVGQGRKPFHNPTPKRKR